MTAFCPELQHPWSFKSLDSTTPSQLRVVVAASYSEASPQILGRHVADISSYPRVRTEYLEAEFTFHEVVWFELRDDQAATLADSESCEGRTFCRFLGSKLLSLQKECWGESTPFALDLMHYRLVCEDTLLDVVCRKVPTITRRYFREPEGLAG